MPPDLADLRVDARWILPAAGHAGLLEEHSVVVRDGRILAVVPRTEAERRFRPTMVVERPGRLLLPGLVNAHTRTDAPAAGLAAADRTQAALAAMLTGGITCFAAADAAPEETARTAAAQGMRAVIGVALADETDLSGALKLRDDYKGHPTISTAFAPAAVPTLADAQLARIATLVDELDAVVQIEAHASAAEIAASRRDHGLRPLERLHRLGLLTPALNALHLNLVDAADLELARRGGISVTLCPAAGLWRGRGPAPVAALRAAGLGIALGTDAGGLFTSQDLWTEIKFLAGLARLGADAPAALSPWECLAAATRGGAAALGLDAEIGTLEAGKWADICCVDLDGPMTRPWRDLPGQLVFSGGRDMVTDVWVAGRHLLAERQLTRLDWPGLSARMNGSGV